MSSENDRYRGALLGLAVGDSVGMPLEFRAPGGFEPLTDMVGGGPFDLQPGQWTDDTSMALCLAASLLDCRGFDPSDQMRRYVAWYEQGYMSCTGECFDIGNTVSDALHRYGQTGDPYAGSTDPLSAGNGSLMRLVPVVLFYHPDPAETLRFAGDSSRTTHGAAEAVAACEIFAQMLSAALGGGSKEEVLSAATPSGVSARLDAVASGDVSALERVRGTGYVVDCLEAALWCFATTDDFRGAVLAAANLGEDADTTAAVCGQIAGAFYGASGIPPHWLSALAMSEEIEGLADRLHDAAARRQAAAAST